ncbi:MAG: preprotein translocase subunit SecE [Gemmataceae bacterium]|nr:preprotein translocase subunit SecE [Gemmataceae bacterium]
MLGFSFWLPWRVVNLPVFADFLIATEGELNKVSWTTRKRLVQDTLVVLSTLLLMAIFLFAMDLFWREVFTRTGVLKINRDTAQKNTNVDLKKW